MPDLKEAANGNDPLARDTLKYAQMLEGNVRNTGVHACGVIIGRYDISDVVPVSTAKDKDTGEEMLVTQYEGSEDLVHHQGSDRERETDYRT